jgi:hypothetical protein
MLSNKESTMAKKKAQARVRSREEVQKDIDTLLEGGMTSKETDQLQVLLNELRALGPEKEVVT